MSDSRQPPTASSHRATANSYRWSAWLALVLLTATPALLHAHLALSGSSPSPDSRLVVVPDAIRLTFTEPIELSLSRLLLHGPSGSIIQLGALSNDNGVTLAAEIIDGLGAGEYRVEWQAVGRDGHPVRGAFAFTIEDGAVGIAKQDSIPGLGAQGEGIAKWDSVAGFEADDVTGAPVPEPPTFSSRSPLYAVVRWLMYVGIVGTLGALGFYTLLRSSGLARLGQGYLRAAERGAAAFGLFAVLPLALSVPLRIQAQSHAVFGAGVTRERFAALTSSLWGMAWAIQALACLLGGAGFLMARRGARSGWLVAGGAAIGMVVTPALSGHAASVEDMRLIAFLADSLHVTGAGLWIGSLAAMLLVGIPLIGAEAPAERGSGLSTLVTAFSPLAMVAAGMLVATGIVSAWFQLSELSDLWGTSYGRLLSAKLFLVLLVLALGAFNWRRMRPAMALPGAGSRLRRSGGAEVTAALIAIMLTAVLVAVQPPAHEAESESPIASSLD